MIESNRNLRQSNQISREALQSEQRAFVNFNGISAGAALTTADGKAKAAQILNLNWFNSGNTPAKDGVTLGNLQMWRGELPSGFDFKDINAPPPNSIPHNIVGPHQGVPIQLAVGIDNFRAQRAGTDRMFFYGWIVYKDVFAGDPDRLTEFCTEMIQVAIFDAKKDIADPSQNFSWNTQPCRENNCYDEDCKDYSEKIKQARTP